MMFRLKTISSMLVYGAATLVLLVFLLHLFIPTYHFSDNEATHADQQDLGSLFLPQDGLKGKRPTTVSGSDVLKKIMPAPIVECYDKSLSIEQYRARSVIRGVIVRFPSKKSNYYFVQFRWFYRSWIESEMFTLDRWRTDIIILIDDDFPKETRQSLEHLNCHADNKRTSRRQLSRCVLINHKLLSERSKVERQNYTTRYPIFNRTDELSENVDRLFAVYDYASQLNEKNQTIYDFLMVTTMNTFLTTQFGKYIPVKCAFLLGAAPDYSTWYGQTEQILGFVHMLLVTLKDPTETPRNTTIDYLVTIESLQTRFLFLEKQVDIPCDSKMTTYRTHVFHIKCYAHSTSLFSERMFRDKAYDGFDKEPFNIYIAREYATLMALQSKVMSLEDLRSLAVNVTRREVYT